ncbi:MAG: hypothetical protein Q7O66_02290 [Dehalococcoidia bacterium]|nr:hypothetical protein [Dehalococcoidia bacterium]
MTSVKKRPFNRATFFLASHVYISLAALAVVLVHVLPRAGHIKWSLTWVSVFMVATIVASGFFGKYLAKTPLTRRNWRYFHLPYTVACYLVVLPHIINQGF